MAIDSYCSSAIVRLSSGELVNVRNTDYFNPDEYRNTTYWARWEKDGKHVFTSLSSAGLVGVYNAVKGGKFSVSINSRYPHGEKFLEGLNIAMLFSGFYEVT